MFAKRSQKASAPSRPASTAAGGAWARPLSNPYLGAAGAAVLFFGSAAALVLVAGDPHAGAPVVRIPLQANAPKLPEGPLRGFAGLPPGTLPPGVLGSGAVSLDTLQPGQDVLLPGAAPAPLSGEAVVTLPQGGAMGAAQASARPAAPRPMGPPLPPAPIAGLTTPGPGGLLPIVGKDGRTPFQAYARPFHDNGRPRIAMVVGGLGLNAAATRAAIERLPPEVTLSFVPYAEGLQGWVDLARAAGHEVMIEIPMEPLDYPNNDPGPYTLMAQARPEDTVKRLEWLLSRVTGYFAVTNYLGGRFLAANNGMAAFTVALKGRGLGFVDDGSAPKGAGGGVPRASADAVVDEQLSAEAIDRQLIGLEGLALQRGQALGAGFAYPLTVEAVIRWTQGLPGRGYQLAPASALARR